MSQPFRFRLAALPFLLTAATLFPVLNADAADLRQRLNVRQDASEIVLGETMYDFYQGNSFAALNKLVLARSQKQIDDSNTTSEMLLGDLYTSFGMSEEADTVFSRIIARDMQTQTRNVTIFRKARLQYQRGDFFEAERALNSPLSTQVTDIEAERRVLLANVLMARNDYDRAREELAPIPLNTTLGIYATYNTGVAHLRANRGSEGIALLEQVMNLPVSDDETNALKDRAAMAISYHFLQNKQPDKARDALVNVRLNGPFSNPALLALGYVNYERKDYKRALSFWLELMTRSPGDPSVQEAMILAPRAYEALKAEQQAFNGYKLAINNLNNQIAVVDSLAEKIKKPEWLDSIDPSISKGIDMDPMKVPASVTPVNHDEVTSLYGLFSGHTFSEGFQQYEQLKRLKELMKNRSAELQSMRDMASELNKRKAALPALNARFDQLQNRITQVSERWPILEKRARQDASATGNRRSAAAAGSSLQAMERQFNLGQIDNKIGMMPAGPVRQMLENRVRVLKGLISMEAASKAPVSRDQIYANIASNEAQMQLVRLRLDAVKQLLANNKKVANANNAGSINDFDTRIQASIKSLDKALDEYRAYLRVLAENQLEDTKSRINNDLAEAHLSIARLQDTALARDAAGK